MFLKMNKVGKTLIRGFAILGAILFVIGVSWLWRNRNRSDVYYWLRRPDIALALHFVTQINKVDEDNIGAEWAVKYLTNSNYEAVEGLIGGLLLYECGISGVELIGPANYAARILSQRETEESKRTLMSVWLARPLDGPSLCKQRAGEGIALKGEATAYEVLELARNPGAPIWVRIPAIRWLGDMGSDKELSHYCKPALGCEPLGTKVGEEWLQTLVLILKHDYDRRIRANAATAIGMIGLPEGVQALEEALEEETDEGVIRSINLALGGNW